MLFSNTLHSSWSRSELGECICYKGKPVTEDFRLDYHAICTSGGQYVWGFSSSIIFVGILLEAVWCYVCTFLLLPATQQSRLVRRGRPATGVIRAVLDLAGALNQELGPGVSWYNEKQLRKKLLNCQPVAYRLWDEGETKNHVGLTSAGREPTIPTGRKPVTDVVHDDFSYCLDIRCGASQCLQRLNEAGLG